ncbi:hypothetical protein M422DRAFT_53943 [Sphaerobolus stellatus SS14]|uniref:Unplaced genomic scaffold SPHSTscaffold_196, whole genome shotgun sequence n=1 Tax=Sphaerobolus stellatus (strain SS14) TaxID=990650 RepID=A0A0C9UY14_SPHS4|nr:hypothetical protein M422DRAFT_53943 [Sphaerobolus stellatus SS14]
MLLAEVGNLREEKRNLQHELGYLMCMRSKYGPGGEFDPDCVQMTLCTVDLLHQVDFPQALSCLALFRQALSLQAFPPGFQGRGPFPDDPSEAPLAPPPAKPEWRNIQTQGTPKLSKRQRKLQREQEEAAAAAGPSEPAPRAHS